MPNIRQLDLSELPIGAKGARFLTDEKFSKLTRLGLENCKLNDAAIYSLCTSPNLQNVIQLNINGNNVKTGVTALADRGIMPRLSLCLLNRNPIAFELRRKLARRPGVHID